MTNLNNHTFTLRNKNQKINFNWSNNTKNEQGAKRYLISQITLKFKKMNQQNNNCASLLTKKTWKDFDSDSDDDELETGYFLFVKDNKLKFCFPPKLKKLSPNKKKLSNLLKKKLSKLRN